MARTHPFTATKADGGDATKVKPSDWNADHIGSDIEDRDLTQVDVANTTTQTSIYSQSIGAGLLGVDGGLWLTLGGDMLKNVAGSITIRIKLGATTVFDSGGVTPTSLGDRYKWTFSIWFMNSTASAQKWNAWMNAIATAQAFAALLGDSVQALHMEGQASSAEDTSSARTLEVTIEWSVASASLSFRREIALLELLPKS